MEDWGLDPEASQVFEGFSQSRQVLSIIGQAIFGLIDFRFFVTRYLNGVCTRGSQINSLRIAAKIKNRWM